MRENKSCVSSGTTSSSPAGAYSSLTTVCSHTRRQRIQYRHPVRRRRAASAIKDFSWHHRSRHNTHTKPLGVETYQTSTIATVTLTWCLLCPHMLLLYPGSSVGYDILACNDTSNYPSSKDTFNNDFNMLSQHMQHQFRGMYVHIYMDLLLLYFTLFSCISPHKP